MHTQKPTGRQLVQTILLSCANPFKKRPAPFFSNISTSDVDWNYLLKLAKDNKISPKVFERLNEIPNAIRSKINKWINGEETRIQNLNKSLRKVCQLLNDQGIKYIIIKSFRRYPFFSFTDYDFLIADKEDLERALRILRTDGFIFKSNRIFEEPYKFICVKKGSEMDIYTRVAWDRIKVADANLMIKRRLCQHRNNCLVYLPTAEDELLIDCSHTFVHGAITLGDAFDAMLHLQEKIDWKYVVDQAEKNCLILYLYSFLNILDHIHYIIYEKRIVPQYVLKILQNYKIVKFIQHLLVGDFGEKKEIIPYKIPFLLILVSALHRIRWNFKSDNPKGFLEDIKGHFLMVSSYFLERFNISLSFIRVRSPSEIDKL